jgi:hypothetical protein
MQVTLDVSERVAARAESEGVSLETFIQRAAERAATQDPELDLHRIPPGPYTPEEAGRNIRELRKKNLLGGLKIKDLIDDGRKY